MQAISVYLYPNKLDVFTKSLAEWPAERYRRVYNKNVKVYRGVDNRIDLLVKNADQKALDVTGYSLVFSLVGRETQELILQKDCSVIDAEKGRYYVTLTESEMFSIEPGMYQYSVIKESRQDLEDGSYSVTSRDPLYIDSQYGMYSTVEVGASILGEPVDSKKITAFSKYVPYDTEPAPKYYISSIVDANPNVTTPQSVHTFQFNLTSYTGTLLIQGSISEGGNPQVWADLETLNATADSILYTNITGKYNWFRVKHTPDSSLTDPGTVDSILYR